MKIAFFTSNRSTIPPDPSVVAASATHTVALINQLKTEHDITLYAAQGSQIPGVRVVDLGLPAFKTDSSLADNDWTTKTVLGMKQIYVGAILADAEQYDIIHIQTEPAHLGMPYANLVPRPVLFTCHNVYHPIEKEIYEYADRTDVYLSGLSKSHTDSFPMSRPVPFVHNGVEESRYPFDGQGGDYFLFLGRLVKEKGILEYLKLAPLNPDTLFYVAGQGPEARAVEEASKKHPNIVMKGMCAHESKEWFEIMSKARALVAPIRWEEPFGLVFIEAMAMGTPVIACRRGSVPEIVEDGTTGYIARDDAIESLQRAVLKIKSLPDKEYKQMRRQSRERAEQKFSARIMAKGYEKLYQDIIKDFETKRR